MSIKYTIVTNKYKGLVNYVSRLNGKSVIILLIMYIYFWMKMKMIRKYV